MEVCENQKERLRAQSWCINNDIKIYSVPAKDTYVDYKEINGIRRRVQILLCWIEVDFAGTKKRGKILYKQGEEMSDKIFDLYCYYYSKYFRYSNKDFA